MNTATKLQVNICALICSLAGVKRKRGSGPTEEGKKSQEREAKEAKSEPPPKGRVNKSKVRKEGRASSEGFLKKVK